MTDVYIFSGLCGAIIAFGLFMFARVEWVGRQRLKLINKFYGLPINEWWERTRRGEEYDSDYLTFGQMMWRFWVWDVEKLRKP